MNVTLEYYVLLAFLHLKILKNWKEGQKKRSELCGFDANTLCSSRLVCLSMQAVVAQPFRVMYTPFQMHAKSEKNP